VNRISVRLSSLGTHRTCVVVLYALTALLSLSPTMVSALTVRTKSDLRLWETVMDRSQELSWTWEVAADSAHLSFSNRLTHAVSVATVAREPGALRGTFPHPVAAMADEALVAATLVQTAKDVEVAREMAELAYLPGVLPCVATTVRTKKDRDWWRVPRPRLAAYDARWWNVAGASGYEVLWAVPAGPHRVVREFEGAGVVDETVLKFGTLGLMMLLQ